MLQSAGGLPTAASPRDACRDELTGLLEFLEPSVEFGLLQPMADYLDWTARCNGMRSMTGGHMSIALDRFAEYFLREMGLPDGAVVADALRAVKAVFVATGGRREPLPAPSEPWQQMNEFTDALVAGHRDEAARMMDAYLDGERDLVAFQLHVMQPALYEIGRRWQHGTLSVASEHLATDVARAIMAAGSMRIRPGSGGGRRALLACAEGNRHDLGLQMVGDAFRCAGWRVRCLGADVPTHDLVQHAWEWKADILGISIAFAHQLRSIRAIASAVRALAQHPTLPILAGGIAAMRYERLARFLGADDVAADAASAVLAASRLIEGERT
jgi:methanogenic corrinoid protein MtbC1